MLIEVENLEKIHIDQHSYWQRQKANWIREFHMKRTVGYDQKSIRRKNYLNPEES